MLEDDVMSMLHDLSGCIFKLGSMYSMYMVSFRFLFGPWTGSPDGPGGMLHSSTSFFLELIVRKEKSNTSCVRIG